jgi:glucokinase
MDMDELVMAVDLGGTQARIALIDRDLEIRTRSVEPTRAREGAEPVLGRLIQRMDRLGSDVGWDRIPAIGVSAPGPLDPQRGVILWVPNLPDWRDIRLTERLGRAVGRPVFLGNDANTAALAEHRLGSGRGHSDMVYITVSTGIGSGIISDGRLLLGHRGLAGEVGHMILEPNGPRCNCGSAGCLEALASGTAIARQARDLVAAGGETFIAELACHDPDCITARLVHEAATGGDAVAVELLRRAGTYLGLGLVNLMRLFNPGLVAIGGGVTNAGEFLFAPMHATIRERIGEIYWQHCPIGPPALGGDVCLKGAAILAWDGLADR